MSGQADMDDSWRLANMTWITLKVQVTVSFELDRLVRGPQLTLILVIRNK